VNSDAGIDEVANNAPKSLDEAIDGLKI
jgi:hypothetical protein